MATGIDFEKLAVHPDDVAAMERAYQAVGWVDIGLFRDVDGDDLFGEQPSVDASGRVYGLFSACGIAQEGLRGATITGNRIEHAIPKDVTVSGFGLYLVGLAEETLDVGSSDEGQLGLEAGFQKPDFSLVMYLTSEFYTERGRFDPEDGKLRAFSAEEGDRVASSVWAVFHHTLTARLRAFTSQ